MKSIAISSITIAILGAILTWLFLLEATGPILFWAALVGWACFIHCGADNKALRDTIACNILGIVIAWIAAFLVVSIPADALGLALSSGIVVGVGLLVLVLLSGIPAFSSVPAGLLGYASALAYIWEAGILTGEQGVLSTQKLLAADFTNPFILVVVSMVIGAVVGYAAEKVVASLSEADAGPGQVRE
ncbi:MAG: DUF1097 domain-containing protein [Proteobacteria bacterium]|nr:DUF1097 domain-containing protein [Pseudomonadota bacterium]